MDEILNLSSIRSLLDDADFSLPLIVGLSTGLAVLFVVLLLLAIYLTFTNNPIFLGSNFNVPGEFDDEESRRHEEATELPKLHDVERENYLLAREFQIENPPVIKPLGGTLSEVEAEYVTERGIQAYQFETPELWYGSLDPCIIIEDKLDLSFNSNLAASTILNYPLPVTTADTTYFEVKLYNKPVSTFVSIGLSSKPYPLFALPGHHRYSLAYDSTGSIRINEPFSTPAIFHKLQQGDVLGVGYKQRSGTVFFTHNGKKVHDAIHNLKFDLYPHIGSIGHCELSVNLGQLGFVYIEANVKKWGFGTTFGAIGIPPAYGKEVGEVLDKGEELPPTYPVEEETFFGPSALLTSSGGRIGGGEGSSSLVDQGKKNRPPSYKDDILKEGPSHAITNEDLNEGLYERRSSGFDLQNNSYEIEEGSQLLNPNKALSPLPEPHEEPPFDPIEPADSVDDILELSESVEDASKVDSNAQSPPDPVQEVSPSNTPLLEQIQVTKQVQDLTNISETSPVDPSTESNEQQAVSEVEDIQKPSTPSTATSNKSQRNKKRNKKKKKGKR